MAKLLVIDDSFLQRHILKRFVLNKGHEVVEVADGAAGLAAFQKEDFDAVLCDLLMPGMSGFDVLEAIRSSGSSAPVVIISADIQKSTKEKCFELGANAFVNKPVEEQELFKVVDALLVQSESA